MTEVTITLRCPQCAATKFRAQSGAPSTAGAVVCAACGTVVDLAAEKRRLEQEARAKVEVRLRDVTPKDLPS
jgi:uncharacterized Zn finger protein (UPF0148 family)